MAQMVESACNVGDLGSIPGLERSPGEGIGCPLQYSCLENPMDRGACPWGYSPQGCKGSGTTERRVFSIGQDGKPSDSDFKLEESSS